MTDLRDRALGAATWLLIGAAWALIIAGPATTNKDLSWAGIAVAATALVCGTARIAADRQARRVPASTDSRPRVGIGGRWSA